MREEHVEKLKQFLWRPRPLTFLSKEEQKAVRKNLRDYSKDFEEEDRIAEDTKMGAVVDERRRLLNEWLAWRASEAEEVRHDRREFGLPEEPEDELELSGPGEDAQVVEEIVEEIVDETEEILS